MLVVVQFLLTRDVDLPDDGWTRAAKTQSKMPEIAGSFVPPILLQQSIFAPTRTAQASGADAPIGPLGGASIAGAISVGGRSYAIVQGRGGGVSRVPIGGRVAGWRLRSLSGDNAIFEQSGKRLAIPYGAAAPNPDTQPPVSEDQES